MNVYQTPLQGNSQSEQSTASLVENGVQQTGSSRKRTFTHKKRITSMTLSVDNNQLITGDSLGTIYVWNLKADGDNSGGAANAAAGSGQNKLLQTLDIHREYGGITNLVPLTRPLSLFGLTANMQAYEPGDFRVLQRNQQSQQEAYESVLSVQLAPINERTQFDDDREQSDSEDEDNLGQQMTEYAELEYFCQVSQNVA